MVKISADSTCDLSRALIEQHHIDITPLYIVMQGKAYLDGVEITREELFRKVAESGKIGSTAAVNVEDYVNFFAAQKKEHEGIVHFTISSEMSCCYQNACLAAENFENVFVVDSRSLSTGIGHLALDAAIMAESGASAEEIFRAMEEKKSRLDVSFVINTLEFLKMGGRCSSLAAMGANMLGLKPCIEVADGKMGVCKKYRGHLERCLQKYVADRLNDADQIDSERIFITDSGVPDEMVKMVEEEIRRHVPFKEIIHTHAGCTVSNHCGPNCLGILFYRRG